MTEGRWLWSDRSNRLALGKDNRDARFRAWKKGEPSNMGIGLEEENCAALESHTRGIALNHGLWNDLQCGSKQPYVCQKHGSTTDFSVTVAQKFTWGGSAALKGPGRVVVKVGAVATIEDAGTKKMEHAVKLVNNGELSWRAGVIEATEGSSIHNNAKISIAAGDFQEGANGEYAMSSGISNSATGTIEKDAASSTTIEARLHNAGSITVQSGTLNFPSGGISDAKSNYNIAADGVLEFSGARQQFTRTSHTKTSIWHI